MEFSSVKRQETLRALAEGEFDILIVGGGITGAGVAMDAAARGLKVALIDKQDFAAGTSSRSTKLIHGGLRYLKQLEVGLVAEVGRERAILYKNAPHLVIPEKMLLPITEGGTYGKFAASMGLWVYDFVADVNKTERRVMLDKNEALAREPLLDEDGLLGAGLYYEYRTDDARLTIEVLKTAVHLGAVCLNYVEGTGFEYNEEGRIKSVKVKDLLGGGAMELKTKYVVNAAGPWVDSIRRQEGEEKHFEKHLHLTKGVHLVVPHQKFPLRQSIYFDVPDGRMLFAIPRENTTYIGTTDTNVEKGKDIEEPLASKEDAAYLLDAVNTVFPKIKLQVEDVVSSWAGYRPLIHEEGKGPSELSRKDEIFYSKSGLVSIAGGKLTGFRKMAERVTDVVAAKLLNRFGVVSRDCATDNQKIGGSGGFQNPEEAAAASLQLYGLFSEKIEGLTKTDFNSLFNRYGRDTEIVLSNALRFLKSGNSLPIALARGEALHCINNEMCCKLEDFFVRRTGMLYFNRTAIPLSLDAVADDMASMLGWTEAEKEANKAEVMLSYKGAVGFL